MSNHHLDLPDRDMEDSAFEPRSSFDFDEEVNNLGHNMAGFHGFPGQDLEFNLMNGIYDGDDDFDQEFFHGRNGGMVGVHPFTQNSQIASQRLPGQEDFGFASRPHVAEPRSAQSNIVNSRKDHVSQQFGQITPPQENDSNPSKAQASKASQMQQTSSQEPSKLSNEQRARNAANTRHSRTKSTKKNQDQNERNSDGETDQKQGKNITLQREKNRVAAAKCRAKKKSANEQQEELASQYGTTNSFLTREIRELKNQKTELQNYLLAHRPGVCECHGIHDYNFGQAQRLVLNARRHAVDPVSSPSRESVLSAQSSGSEASGMFTAPDRGLVAGGTDMPTRRPSFQDQMNYGFSENVHHEPMQVSARGGQPMSHEFSDFLQSSPGGRAGFS